MKKGPFCWKIRETDKPTHLEISATYPSLPLGIPTPSTAEGGAYNRWNGPMYVMISDDLSTPFAEFRKDLLRWHLITSLNTVADFLSTQSPPASKYSGRNPRFMVPRAVNKLKVSLQFAKWRAWRHKWNGSIPRKARKDHLCRKLGESLIARYVNTNLSAKCRCNPMQS